VALESRGRGLGQRRSRDKQAHEPSQPRSLQERPLRIRAHSHLPGVAAPIKGSAISGTTPDCGA
jgi:hypothetical protein